MTPPSDLADNDALIAAPLARIDALVTRNAALVGKRCFQAAWRPAS